MIIKIEITTPKGNREVRETIDYLVSKISSFILSTQKDTTLVVEKSFEDE